MNTFHPTSHPAASTVSLCALALALVATPALAQGKIGVGDLLVAPTRVVLEGRQRSAELTLVNTGSATATYRISFIQIRMDENGGTRESETPEPGELSASQLIRYSPRQVVLEPNVAQTVRMQLRKPADLAPGEYRSHLLFRAVPAAEPAAAPDVSAAPPQELSIKLTAIYGVSIPVIVRHGETSATVTLSDLELVPPSATDATPALRFRMNRTGNRSVYGNLTVTFLPDAGPPVVVGLENGGAVYTPNPFRLIAVALRPPAGTVLAGGILRLTYSAREKRNETLAEAVLRLP